MSHGELKAVFRMADLPRLAGGSYELILSGCGAMQAELARAAAGVEQDGGCLKLSFRGREEADAALKSALGRGATLEAFSHVHGRLEDLFVRLVSFDEAREGGR